MTRIDWMLVCDLAYFDQQARLCTVGITTHFLVPSVPVSLRHIMMVARLADPQPGTRMDIGVAVSTPRGQWIAPTESDDLQIEVASQYILVTLRDLPLREEGTYRFALHLDPEQQVAVDVPVFVMSAEEPRRPHV